MILIADSGSTNTDWRLIDSSGKDVAITTSGINPYYRTTDDIANDLHEKLLPLTGKNLSAIFFYGAGITDVSKGEVIKKALQRIFDVSLIETYSDLLGAARALWKNKPGITCILGTGSNACFYDGKVIADRIPSLGFVLGDEGSGAVLGKMLVGDYFKKAMPMDVCEQLESYFSISESDILERVYRSEKPNQFLAGLTGFLVENRTHPYCHNLLVRSFSEFFSRNVLKLNVGNCKNLGVVGSVGFIFQDVFLESAKLFGFDQVHFIKDPIDSLSDFHRVLVE